MSLDYNLSAVAIPDEEKRNSLTRDIIFSTMIVHLGTINERNAREWVVRLRILQRIGILDLGFEDDKLHALVHMYKGLRVNVLDKSRAAFLKHAIGMIERDVESELRREAAAEHERADAQLSDGTVVDLKTSGG